MKPVRELSATVQHNRWYLLFVRVGLTVFGTVYGLLGLLVLLIAWDPSFRSNSANFYTVLEAISRRPMGRQILLFAAVGLVMIALWQVIEALVGYVHLRGVRRFNRRVASVGRAFMYLGLGALTFLVALDVELRGNTTWADIVDETLGRRGGRQLIVAVGCVIIAIGIGQMGRGIGRIFVDEFEGPVSRWVVALGLVGYVMLGLSVVLVGGALAWSAISVHPEYAGTISTVIKILVETPLLGPVLGTIVAAGFVSFAVFCIAWSTQPLHATRVER